jgi:endo-1,4-beta-xylanase
MTPPRRSHSSIFVFKSFLAAFALAACANSEPSGNETGTAGTFGGSAGTTGGGSTGGTGPGPGTAGTLGNGGSSVAGTVGTTGSAGTGSSGTAGATGAAGSTVTGTAGHGGTTGAAGTGSAGTNGLAGRGGTTGSAGTTGLAGRGGTTGSAGTTGLAGRGGTTGSAGTTGLAGRGGTTGTAGTTGTGGAAAVDCNAVLPSGGTAHNSSNAQGTAGGLSWSIWTNSGPGTITTFSVPAFSASWNNSGDFLARIGLQFGSSGKAVSALGTVTAQYAETKTGSAGGYSYVGIYGWSVNPCIEWYIVDDSFNNLPFNPGGTSKGTVTIDSGTYNVIQRNTTGTGGNRCGNVTQWDQFYSIRTSKKSCGTITISDHFKAWSAAGLNLGNVLEASILIEAGGGSGSISFPIANVTSTP